MSAHREGYLKQLDDKNLVRYIDEVESAAVTANNLLRYIESEEQKIVIGKVIVAVHQMKNEAIQDAVDRGLLDPSEDFDDNLPDNEADAQTLASAGMGTDEDYGLSSYNDF